MPDFCSQVQIETPRKFAFRWHEFDGAFNRLTPAWEPVEMVSKTGGIADGEVQLRVKVGPLKLKVTARHSRFVQDQQFFDEMVGGPFKVWEHFHKFDDGLHGEKTILTDQIRYQIKLGWLGHLVAGRMVRKKLERLFAYRHQVTKNEIEDHFQFADQTPKTIAVTGATGLIGKSICDFLKGGGHRVIELPRFRDDDFSEAGWNPESGKICFGDEIRSVDCILHLAGYGVADKRWNKRVKELIRTSRVDATRRMVDYLESHQMSPESFICASAAGYYGDRGAEPLDEDAAPGEGFLAETCQQWEDACEFRNSRSTRVANLRFGLILSAGGGALTKMLTPFKFFLGGSLGSGQQFWSWISFFDTLRAIHYTVMNPEVSGPVNLVAPQPVTQKSFANSLATVLRRTSFVPLPRMMLRLAVGEMAEELLLASANIECKKLTDCGFRFVHPKLEDALRFELGRLKLGDSSLN